MKSIMANPDPDRLAYAPDAASGPPIAIRNKGHTIPPERLGATDTVTLANGHKFSVQYAIVSASELVASHDTNGSPNKEYESGRLGALRVAVGNGRAGALIEAYAQGTAEGYKKGIPEKSRLHGTNPDEWAKIPDPILIRLMNGADVTKNFGDEGNQSPMIEKTPLETTVDDAARVDLAALPFDDDGNLSVDAVRQFIDGMPKNEQNALIQKGVIQKTALDRFHAAVFWKAYGNEDLVKNFVAAEGEAKNVTKALASAASKMIRLGDVPPKFDIREIVAEAAVMVMNAVRSGQVKEYMAQQNFDLNPEVLAVAEVMVANMRSAKRLGEILGKAATRAYEEATKDEEGLFGPEPRASREEIVRGINENYAEGSKKNVGDTAGGAPDEVVPVGDEVQSSGPTPVAEAAPVAESAAEEVKAPEVKAPEAAPSADEQAKSKALDDLKSALGDLGDILGKNAKKNMLPEQEQKLLPVLVRVFDAAFRLGHLEFKAAAKFVLDKVREAYGAETADAISLQQLQGAYIGMSTQYSDKGADSPVKVVAVTSKDELAEKAPPAPPPAAAPKKQLQFKSEPTEVQTYGYKKIIAALNTLIEGYEAIPGEERRLVSVDGQLVEIQQAWAAGDREREGLLNSYSPSTIATWMDTLKRVEETHAGKTPIPFVPEVIDAEGRPDLAGAPPDLLRRALAVYNAGKKEANAKGYELERIHNGFAARLMDARKHAQESITQLEMWQEKKNRGKAKIDSVERAEKTFHELLAEGEKFFGLDKPESGKRIFAKGDMVTFSIPGINGPKKVVGRIDRVTPTGAYDVRSQSGGIFALIGSDMTPYTPANETLPDTNAPRLDIKKVPSNIRLGLKVKVPAMVGNKVVDREVSAQAAMDAINDEMKTYQELLDCIGA